MNRIIYGNIRYTDAMHYYGILKFVFINFHMRLYALRTDYHKAFNFLPFYDKYKVLNINNLDYLDIFSLNVCKLKKKRKTQEALSSLWQKITMLSATSYIKGRHFLQGDIFNNKHFQLIYASYIHLVIEILLILLIYCRILK